jgi:hypothetical protein
MPMRQHTGRIRAINTIENILLLVTITMFCSCSEPVDRKAAEVVAEVEQAGGRLSDAEWKVYDERMARIEEEYRAGEEALDDSSRAAYHRQVGRYRMLRMMEALDEFGQDVQDMVEEMKGAVDVMIDSLELLAPGHH